ncbi:hypothetical protein K6L09_21195 [Burkholderia cepacia]
MNYLVEMRLVKIKTPQEIEQEIREGVYKGDSHVYESIFKDNNRIIGRIAQMGSSAMERESISRIIRNAIAKLDNKPLSEVDLGRVQLKDITDSSFPIISRTYDFMSEKVATTFNGIRADDEFQMQTQNVFSKIDQAAKKEKFADIASDITASIVDTIQAVRKSVADQFGLEWMKNKVGEQPVAYRDAPVEPEAPAPQPRPQPPVDQAKVELTMKPNRTRYTSMEDVVARLEAYEARRQAKLAINGNKAPEATKSAQEAPVRAQQVSKPTQHQETAQITPQKAPEQVQTDKGNLEDPDHLSGIVKDFGPAPYLHDEKNDHSYYVVLESNGQTKTKWGIDIQRAFSEAEVSKGDFVQLDKKKVEDGKIVLDENGQEVKTYKNIWEATIKNEKKSSQSVDAAQQVPIRQKQFEDEQIPQAYQQPSSIDYTYQVETQKPKLVITDTMNVVVDYESSISSKDPALSPMAMFDEVMKKVDLKYDGAKDYFKSFDWNPLKNVDFAKLALEDFQPKGLERHELIHDAMKTMLEQQHLERMGASEEKLELLVKRQKFEKALFAYRIKEDGLAQKGQDVSSLQPNLEHLNAIYQDYKVDQMGKTFRDDIVIKRAEFVESDEIKSQRMRENRVDYSHNPKLQALVDKVSTRSVAQREFDNWKADPVFSMDSMLGLMEANTTMLPSIKLRPTTIDRVQATKDAFEYKRLNDSLIQKFEEAGQAPMKMDLPRDFFSNTYFDENSIGLDKMLAEKGQQRQNKTGEFIAYSQTIAGEFYKEGKRNRHLHSDTMDLIVANNIDKAISAGYKNMYDTHKRELNSAEYEQREVVEAKHAFEKSYFDWQEENYKKPLEQKDLAGLEAVHTLYQDWMEKSTGLPTKPPFTVEEKTQELLQRKQKASASIGATKTKAQALSDNLESSMKAESKEERFSLERSEQIKDRVKMKVLQMRQK